MLRQLPTNWKFVKTYATEAALMKRIEQDKGLYPEHDDRFMVVRTRKAVGPLSSNST